MTKQRFLGNAVARWRRAQFGNRERLLIHVYQRTETIRRSVKNEKALIELTYHFGEERSFVRQRWLRIGW